MLPRRATLLLAGVALASAVFTIAAIDRSPLVDVDEVYIASAALSLARHGAGVPTVLPAGPWNVPFPLAYGPVFFRIAAAAIRWFGVSAIALRSVCLAAALAMSAATAWLVRRGGGSRSSALFAGCLMWLAPEVGRAATNGRMDTVAVALEIAALASIIVSAGMSYTRALTWGSLAGLCTGLAVLTTPRAATFLAGLPAAAIVALWTRRHRGLTAVLACGAVSGACLVIWPLLNGAGPLYYFVTIPAGARLDEFNSFTTAGRLWTLHPVAIGAVAGLTVLTAGVLSGPRPTSKDVMPALLPPLAWVCTSAIVYMARVNHTFFREIYFVTPVTAVVLAIAGASAANGRTTRVLGIACATTAVLFFSVRLVKSVQVVESWKERDPAPLDAFFKTNLPRGSVVVGFDEYYFYSVERAGSHFLVSETEPYGVPFPGSPTVGRPPSSALPAIRAQIQERLLVWPDGRAPLQDAYRCAAGHRIATWIPERHETLMNRLPILNTYAYRLRYPITSIYQMPSNCPIG